LFKVLDVGSGAHPSGDVNIDLYVTAKERGSVQHSHFKMPEYFVKADAHHLPFKSDIFEKVICFHTLEHLNCPYYALKEMYRVLKPEGELVVDVPNVKLLGGGILGHENKTHLYSWSVASLKNLIRHVGFKTQKVYPKVKNRNMQVISKKPTSKNRKI